jgi:hypothetical protein
MSTPLKIDPVELNELLGKGWTTGAIAKHFNCTPGAVSQAKRRIGIAVSLSSARANSARQAAPILVNNAHDAKRELSALITRCSEELDWMQSEVDRTSEDDYRVWQETALKHVAEIRKLVSAIANIEYKLHRVDVVEKALLIIFEEIGRESDECRKRIRDRLAKASILFCMDN